MRILVIADRAPRSPITDILAREQIDLIVTLGDLEHGMLRQLEDVTTIPKIGVYGNHCSGTYMEPLGIRNMHLATWEFGGLRFGGFQGCVRYKLNPYAIMCTQEEASALLADFPSVDVMLTHCPPYGVNDEPGDPTHEGFRGLRDYVLRARPRYLLHGHTYPTEDTIVRQLGDTEIIYVYADAIVTLTS